MFVSPVAQHGESLLWNSWLEKSETRLADSGERSGAPWDDSKLEWDKHVAETYYSYWEQYTYWLGQGWTVDSSGSTETKNEEAVSELWRDGAERQVTAPHHDVEVLDQLFAENCMLELSEKRKVCGSDPRDAGNNCERPSSSSQHNTPQQSGTGVCYLYRG